MEEQKGNVRWCLALAFTTARLRVYVQMPGETSFIFPHAKLQPSPKSVKTPSRLNEHKSLKQSLTVLRNFEIVAARASVTVLEERTWTIRCSRMFHTWEKAQKMQFPFSRRNTFRSIRQESTTLET